jgi:hypothetical protein
LARADPDNTGYQRDVWVSAYQLAELLESANDSSAIDYWMKSHSVLAALDVAGKLAEADRPVLDYVSRKIPRQ